MQLEDFYKLDPYKYSEKEKTKKFNKELKDELIFHYKNNNLYKNFCDKKFFNPMKFNGDINSIPPIPVQVFKTLGSKLSSVNEHEITMRLNSSATSGVPSTILLDKITAKRQTRVMTKVISSFLGQTKLPMIVFDLNIKTASLKDLGARAAAIKAYINFASDTNYVLEMKDSRLSFNEIIFNKLIKDLKEDQPVIIFGFTYVLFDCLMRSRKLKKLKLPKGSKVIHIGGWKKLEDEKISKDEFNKKIAELFDIDSKNNIIDIYGFTEQLGLNYPDCSEGWKHTPLYSEVIIRDVNGKLTADGDIGRLQFVSPLPHSYPGNAVITDDLGVIDKSQTAICKCGRSGKRFKILGRVKKAEIRGCGDVMSNSLEQKNEKASISNKKIKILSHSGDVDVNQSNEEQITEVINDLNINKEWLARQPVEALIGIINKASKIWQDPNFELGDFREKGLGFLINWCKSSNLRELADSSLYNRRQTLDTFCNIPGYTNRQIKHIPQGMTVHWLSGNVPVLGMLILVQSIITKNLNLLKAASTYTDSMPLLLRCFKDISYITPGGYELKGEDLLKTISVVHYGHNDLDVANIVSKAADVRIAWGGADAIHHVQNLQKKWNSQDIMFGPRLSFMAISAESISSPRKARKILRRAATDCSVFDQTACASPHTIFVEKNSHISPKDFAEMLSLEMEKASVRIPVDSKSPETNDQIITIRAVYDFMGEVWAPSNTNWTVLYDEEKGLAKPTYSRVITIKPVDSILETIDYIDESIQTIGLGAEKEKRLDFAELAVARGVDRCPDIGSMTNFEMPWDGVNVIDRLVRRVTLGGPS